MMQMNKIRKELPLINKSGILISNNKEKVRAQKDQKRVAPSHKIG